MRKLIMVVLLIFISGCTIVRIDTKSLDNIIGVVLSKDNNLANQFGKGYKYYIPRGVSYIDTHEYNEKLYSNGYYYFIYIDAVAYYNKIEIDYVENNTAYYSKKIVQNDKIGYLEINQLDNKYFVEYVYNYAKIEAVVAEKDIEDIVLKATYILSTVQFNEKIIKLLLADDYFANREESYDIFKPKQQTDNFLRFEYE